MSREEKTRNVWFVIAAIPSSEVLKVFGVEPCIHLRPLARVRVGHHLA